MSGRRRGSSIPIPDGVFRLALGTVEFVADTALDVAGRLGKASWTSGLRAEPPTSRERLDEASSDVRLPARPRRRART